MSRTYRLPLSKVSAAKRALGAATATETIADDGRYWFDARAGMLGIGLLVQYKGWLAEPAG